MPEVVLPVAILVLAFLYSCVGHAGASGYIAAMSILGVAVIDIRPAALIMNLGVSLFGIWHFVRGGHFRSRLIWPFLICSLPFAFLGGSLQLPERSVSLIIGTVLLLSAIRFCLPPATNLNDEPCPPDLLVSLATGALLGFLAGLTGTGGGIFLTPILLMAGWATPKTAAAASIIFIAGNSLAGLIGYASHDGPLPWHLAYLLPFALVGGFIGSRLGSYKFSHATIRRLLALVLLIASIKLVHKSFYPAPDFRATDFKVEALRNER